MKDSLEVPKSLALERARIPTDALIRNSQAGTRILLACEIQLTDSTGDKIAGATLRQEF
jgi:hypothetical protein